MDLPEMYIQVSLFEEKVVAAVKNALHGGGLVPDDREITALYSGSWQFRGTTWDHFIGCLLQRGTLTG